MIESQPGKPDPTRWEVYDLADALLNDTITAQGARRLQELVFHDAEARQWYIRFMHQTTLLRGWSTADRPSAADAERSEGRGLRVQGSGFRSGQSQSSILQFAICNLQSPVFAGGLLVYTIAALMLGAGLLAAWSWKPPDDVRPTATRAAPATLGAAERADETPKVFFGWITGTKDCRWSGSHTLDSCMAVGQFFLDAGTVEFTYTNGVKARIEGPAICLLKSVNSVELRLGRVVVWSGHEGSGLGKQPPAVLTSQ